jgi:hypothetical protein
MVLLGVVAVVAPTSPWMLRQLGQGNGYIVRAGRWLHAHSQPDELVLTTRRRVAYYAELPVRTCPDTGSVKDLGRHMYPPKPAYFVVEESHVTAPHRNPNFFADLQSSSFGRRLVLIHEEPGPAGKVLIYKIKTPRRRKDPRATRKTSRPRHGQRRPAQ